MLGFHLPLLMLDLLYSFSALLFHSILSLPLSRTHC
jgi:hypothetical protein